MDLSFRLTTSLVVLAVLSGFPNMVSAGEDLERCDVKKSIMCQCGLIRIEVPVALCRERGKTECRLCDTASSMEVCKKYEHCANCDPATLICNRCLGKRYGPYCEQLPNIPTYNESDLLILPEQFRLAPGDSLLNYRYKREEGKCVIPDYLDSAELHCWTLGDIIKCVRHCIWGYVAHGEITKTLECKKDNGAWESSNVMDGCKPYVNCAVTLTGDYNAKLHCTTGMINSPPSCSISCDGGKTVKEYTCTIDMGFFPPLPPCAKKDKSFSTVSYYCKKCVTKKPTTEYTGY